MHEQGIAQDIINTAKQQGNVVAITVACGELGHLPANEMREVLEKMTDWKINIINEPAVVKCQQCQFEGAPKILQQLHDHNIWECQACQQMFPAVLHGDKITLTEVDVQ